jgi:uncharacterized GH25 family protein
MKGKITFFTISIISLLVLSSHDMFLKLKSYYIEPGAETVVYLYNGTFTKSENVIDRKRMKDISVVNRGEKIIHPSIEQWREEDNQTILKIKTGKEGTSVVGVSTKPNVIELSAKEFVEYLKHDGILDVLEARQKSGEDNKPVKEKYSKHVKAIFQVGVTQSDDYKTLLSYPLEFIPKINPYSLKTGAEFSATLIKNGKPVAGELVYASYDGHHGHSEDGSHIEAVKTRTDRNGIVKIKLTKSGHWYLRAINMVKSTEPGIDYESNWATLTFEVK